MPAEYVRPFVKSNKNDYVDAEAIAEAQVIALVLKPELSEFTRQGEDDVHIAGGQQLLFRSQRKDRHSEQYGPSPAEAGLCAAYLRRAGPVVDPGNPLGITSGTELDASSLAH
jgi:hypothetical protein